MDHLSARFDSVVVASPEHVFNKTKKSAVLDKVIFVEHEKKKKTQIAAVRDLTIDSIEEEPPKPLSRKITSKSHLFRAALNR